eukprot:TRINITY_DN5301_c0_g1_i2.p1 TRINITY_DN5301_c0_g1~~TRINITY_DN5301_c0_g1_i2.p1  ORF type:complete len:335 (-),score=44.98 TRINITY_DN5301_c0_g1_i2:44-1048(-)
MLPDLKLFHESTIEEREYSYTFHVSSPDLEPEQLPATEISPAGPNHWKKILKQVKSRDSPKFFVRLCFVRERRAPFSLLDDSQVISQKFGWSSPLCNDTVQPPKNYHESRVLLGQLDPLQFSGIRVRLSYLNSTTMVIIPSHAFLALSNIHLPPDHQKKLVDPDAWDWTRETYKYDDINVLSFLTIWKDFLYNKIVEYEQNRKNIEVTGEVRKLLTEYNSRLRLIPESLPELSELYLGYLETLLQFIEKIQDIYLKIHECLEDKVSSLRELPEADRRTFAKTVNALCPSKGGNISQLFFEMKKMGTTGVVSFLVLLDTKRLFFYLSNALSTRKA